MRADTRTGLLDCAEEAARTRGYDAFSFADLAQAIGIRKASVHHHFATKAILSEALIVRYHDRIAARCAQIDATCDTAAARLAAFVGLYREAVGQGDRMCLCVAFSSSQSTLPDTVTQSMIAYRKMVSGWLETVFTTARQDGTLSNAAGPDREAPALLALVEGAQLAARTARSLETFDRATALFRSRLS